MESSSVRARLPGECDRVEGLGRVDGDLRGLSPIL